MTDQDLGMGGGGGGVVFRRHTIPLDILDELAARFIINMREEEKRDMVRICFQIELAHWFYIDFYVNKQTHLNLQSGTMKEFSAHIFQHVPFLQEHAKRVEEIVEEWREYKLAVPTFGAIILNTFLDKVLLVQGFWTKSSWGFPKGKVNEDEPPHLCAAREVYEETGYDITERLHQEEYIEQIINDQSVRLYLITGVPENTNFYPKSRCEIKDIRWFDINSLPLSKSDLACKTKTGYNGNSFYMVIPFMRDLKQWVKTKLWDRLQFQDEVPKRIRKKSVSQAKAHEDHRRTPQDPRRTPQQDPRKTPLDRRTSQDRRTPLEHSRAYQDHNRSSQDHNRSSLDHSRSSQDHSRASTERRTPLVGGTRGAKKNTIPEVEDSHHLHSQQQQQNQRKRAGKEEGKKSRDDGKASGRQPLQQQQPVQQHQQKQQQQLVQQQQHQQKVVGVQPPGPALLPPGPALLPPNFCPEAWTQFRLSEEEVLLAALSNLPRKFSKYAK